MYYIGSWFIFMAYLLYFVPAELRHTLIWPREPEELALLWDLVPAFP